MIYSWYALRRLSFQPEKHPASEYGYTVVYQRMPEGGYSVVVPAIPEICTFGETLPEARRMAKDAVRCFL